MGSILDSVEKWVGRHPEKLLYAFLDSSGNSIAHHSYETFWQRIDVIASHLSDREALQTGDRVLLVYPPGLEMICALFACARAGLIPVPVSPPGTHGFQASLYRMMHIARDCQAVALLTSRDCNDLLRRKDCGEVIPVEDGAVMDLDWIVTEDFTVAAAAAPTGNPSDIFLLQYTSGSTSSPKGVIVTHENILCNCGLVVDHEAPVAVSWLPQHHDMGLIGYYVYIVLSGGTTYGFSPTSFVQRPALWLETITKHRATASSAPNFAYEYCLRPGRLSEDTLAGLNLASLHFLMAAAEPIKTDTYRRFLQKFEKNGLKPESFFVAYGLAENTLAVTNYGRSTISLNKRALAQGRARTTQAVSEIATATHLMSCGKPLGDNCITIVEPETRIALTNGTVGEVWVTGGSKCLGYWNNPEMTRQTFHARINGDAEDQTEYLRTGDMGFFHDGELYICGRRRDMIIVRGQNYYPQDIETVVEQASRLIRRGCVAAFEIDEDQEATVVVVAELADSTAKPDARALATAVQNTLNIEVGVIAFVPPKVIPKTSSGKLMRFMAKQMWLNGEFPILGQLAREKGADETVDADPDRAPFSFLRSRYRLAGNEPHSLVEAGVDSLDLLVFMHELKELLEIHGAKLLADQVDIRLVQQISIADVFRVADTFERTPEAAIVEVRRLLMSIQEEHRAAERALMMQDRSLAFTPVAPAFMTVPAPSRSVLLTGGTGFLGPFLLKSLIEQTEATIHVLIRATTADGARDRLRAALETVVAPGALVLAQFDRRVVPVCGDLEKPQLGLSSGGWARLANEIDTIYHNAAAVNYLFNYEPMRAANVGGTNEALRLAFDQRLKQFNYVSTTFIFGWAMKDVLYESDANEQMELLDFGYSQSKWVAEKVVADAAQHGLSTRMFRPALITPSVTGQGSSFDIAIRLLAFMIKHGIGVDALNQVSFVPVDVTANNIVAIANLPDTIKGTFHITRDEYSNMIEITDIIQTLTGRRFDLFPLRDFVPEVIRRCTKDDLLFPLLDFLIGSIDRISSMEFKRYDNSGYKRARNASPWGMADPPLEDTVAGILRFMVRTGIA